jgi:hypothetical protein
MLFIMFFYYLRQYTGSRPILIPFLKTFVAGAGMAFILYLWYGLSWLLSLTGSILVYGILIYLVKGISADELQMIRDIIKNTTLGSAIDN